MFYPPATPEPAPTKDLNLPAALAKDETRKPGKIYLSYSQSNISWYVHTSQEDWSEKKTKDLKTTT